ncbi:MAG: hypothetical protein A3K19_03900 [Lentisphaerae bacterium RIFOXYB12_FULL_65_16]|nr:MAG: hypothetical protein A3K18_02965 [Lentisphaerae bacterium RIFOXYA12_64_32]OGV89286.1 MAG: hypothetical protein A3K19_03900 [Lentisphaerae bacterium RIFOXYB12_FULL_65_16]
MNPVGMDDDQAEVVRREAEGPQFRSEAARWEFERARRQRLVVWVTLVLVVLVGWGYGMYRLGQRGHVAGGEAASEGGSGCSSKREGQIEPVGLASAKVKVQCILPSGSDCHASIVKFLIDTAGKHPEQIRVDFDAMEGYSEKELKDKVGSFCAGILINGKADFALNLDGKPVHVSLVGTVPSHFSLYEVGEALQAAFVREYGAVDAPIYALPEGEKKMVVSATQQGEAPASQTDGSEPELKVQGLREIELKE